jgi:hypothetical protein
MSTTPEVKTPYKGLVPYTDEDAEFFFGRERERNFITSNLLGERLTLLYGASGVGKSSVLRAGVEHHIRILAQDNLQRLGKPKYVVVVFNDWREFDPVRGLLAKVEESVKRTLGEKNVGPIDSSLPFTDALLEWCKRVQGQLLIILDQFEEYFLYHADKDGPDTFAQEFPNAVKNIGLPANFLVSFREDAFAKLAFFKVRMPDVFGNYLSLAHLDHEAGEDAIQKPIEQYNKKLANGHSVSIEPALVSEVLKQVETGQVIVGETGRGTLKKETTGAEIETPFLQMVMVRLWKEEIGSGSRVLRLSTLEKLADKQTGETGAERIVRTHLDEVMAKLSPEQQDIATDVFHYLVTPSGSKIAHTAKDLAEYAELPEKKLKSTLEELATGNKRILRGVSRSAGSEPRYEIFHDVLSAPILDWRNRRMLARRAEEQREEIEEKAREEEKAKSATRLRWLAAVLTVMCVLAVGLLIWALTQRSQAQEEAEKAKTAQTVAEEQTKLADDLRKQAQASQAAAEDQSKKLTVALADVTTQSKLAKDNEEKAKREARQARADLGEAIRQITRDLDSADKNYDFAIKNSRNNCDLEGALSDSKKEYETLLPRYEALRAQAQMATVRQKIAAIDQRLRHPKCLVANPVDVSP